METKFRRFSAEMEKYERILQGVYKIKYQSKILDAIDLEHELLKPHLRAKSTKIALKAYQNLMILHSAFELNSKGLHTQAKDALKMISSAKLGRKESAPQFYPVEKNDMPKIEEVYCFIGALLESNSKLINTLAHEKDERTAQMKEELKGIFNELN